MAKNTNKKIKIIKPKPKPKPQQKKKQTTTTQGSGQSQTGTIVVQVDNSKKSIRSGDSQPKQPRPSQQPVIINNQQPSYLNPSFLQQLLQPQANKNITINTPPVNIATNNPQSVQSEPAQQQQQQSNINDAINAFSQKNDERFKTLQDQLSGMNDNFRQGFNYLDSVRKRQPEPSIREETPTPPIREARRTQQTPSVNPRKVIVVDEAKPPQTPSIQPQRDTQMVVSSTPSKAVAQMKVIHSDIKKFDPRTGRTEIIKNTIPPMTYQIPYESIFNKPKLYIDNGKAEPEENKIAQTLTFKSPLPPIKQRAVEGDDIANYLENQVYSPKKEEPPQEQQLVEDDKPLGDSQADINVCPVCSKRYENKDAVHKHLIRHHKADPNDKEAFIKDGKTYKTHTQRDTVISSKDGKKSYKFIPTDYEQVDEETINKIIEDRNREPLERRNQNNRILAQNRKKQPIDNAI